jgi:uncharacterized protein (TIGR02996 family)
MADPKELTAFYAALEANPGDPVTLLALADWHDERGEPGRAACLRWLAREGKAPYRYYHRNRLRFHHETWRDGWWWWTTDREESPWGYPAESALPHKLWQKMRHTFDYDPCVFKEYPTVRSAVEAVLEAWSKPGRKYRWKKQA